MTSLRVLLARLAGLFRRGRMEADLNSELEFHLQMEAERLESGGLTREDARSAALKRFGGVARVKETYRATGGIAAIESVFQDLRYAARSLRKQPGFTTVAVLTLALGIGANTAIYTVLDATMLRPLPFRDPQRLMRISLAYPPRPSLDPVSQQDGVWSYPKYEVFQKLQHSFETTALYRPATLNLSGVDQPELLPGELVSASYFPLLGVQAELGRTFLPQEDAVTGRDLVVVLSHSLWMDRFNADPAILGRKIALNRSQYTVVGVLPAGYQDLGGPSEIWVPLHTDNPRQLDQPFLHSFQQVARLRRGVSAEQAKAEVASLGPRIEEALPAPPILKGMGLKARTLDEARLDPLIRKSVLVLAGAVAFVLLIACVNLANLLLARGTARRREIGIRFAVGASKARIVRYLLTESLLLAGLGAGLGFALAYAGVIALNAINPVNGSSLALGQRLPGLTMLGLNSIHLEIRALLFTMGVAVLTGLLFGVFPAFAGARTDVNGALKTGRERPSGVLAGKSLLVVAEVALTMVLLAGAGLSLKSFERLISTSSGIDPDGLLTVRLNLPGAAAPGFFEQVQQRVAALPGVTSAGVTDCPALAGRCSSTTIAFPDRPPVPAGTSPQIGIHWASPGFLQTMRIPLIRGRWFTSADRAEAPKVVVINETAARRFWPGEDPIGKPAGVGCCGLNADQGGATVIGVVGDVRYGKLDDPPEPDAYVSTTQSSQNSMLLFVRTGSDPMALTSAVRAEIRAINKDQPLYDIKTMRQRISDSSARARFVAVLLTAFAVMAFALAGIGIFGVMSYMVRQRTREIGIRVALGARREDVRGMVLRRATILAAAGTAVGLGGALLSGRAIGSLLYQVRPGDPEVFISISILLIALAAGAAYLPARRASKVDPCVALRSE